MKKLSFVIFNFGRKRLRNLWHTMNCVSDIRTKNPEIDKQVEFILMESGESKFSEVQAEKTNFIYEYYDDPLLTSHRSTLRNKAVEKAEGEWVIVHDNDIIPDPTFFEDILEIIKENPKLEYFSNFQDVINLSQHLFDILITDLRTENKYQYGYVNGTDPNETKNFRNLDVRPHGYFTFNEATGGSFTLKKKLYQKVLFDETYNDWGAEDNFFKLSVIQKIGWEKFGMQKKTLLHSYHDTGETISIDPGVIFINESLVRNRNMFYTALDEIEPTLKTDQYEKELKNKIFISKKKETLD
jgi:hypothetical protein